MRNTAIFFGSKSANYEEYAKIQSEVADFAAKFAKESSVEPYGLWLDLGSGTGFAKKKFAENFPKTDINIITADIAFSSNLSVCCDFDFLPFANNSFDGIISCSALQWSKNIENLINNAYKILNDGGKFMCSVFENGTLGNLQKTQKKFDILSQVSFFDKIYFENLLKKTGFTVSKSESKTFSQKFSDGYFALKSISKIGATNHGGKVLSPKILKDFVKEYENTFTNGEIIHNYRTLFYILEKK